MIFTTLNENGKIIFNEGYKFKSKEEAEKALEKVKNNESKTWEILLWTIEMVGAATTFTIPISAIGTLLIQSQTNLYAKPGSAKDRIKKCKILIERCNKTLNKLRKKNDSESEKLASQIEKVRKRAYEEKAKYEEHADDLGKIKSNFKESYSDSSILNEGFKFKSKEEAEKALEKASKNENSLADYIDYGFKVALTPAIRISGIIIPIGLLLTNAFTTWIAFPGSAASKLSKCEKVIKKCDHTINSLSKKNDDDSKKLIDEYKKVRNCAIKERDKAKDRVKDLGKFSSNYRESYSEIFDNVEMI